MLASSPAAKQALAQLEVERATARKAILDRLRAATDEARANVEATAKTERDADSVVRLAEQSLIVARGRRNAASMEATIAVALLDSATNKGMRALAPLGSDAIESTLARVRFSERSAQCALTYHVSTSRQGIVTTLTTPELLPRIARLAALAAELERLRLADVTPSQIETRCAEIIASLDSYDERRAGGVFLWMKYAKNRSSSSLLLLFANSRTLDVPDRIQAARCW